MNRGRSIVNMLGALTLEKVKEIGFEHARLNQSWIETGKSIREWSGYTAQRSAALVIAAGPSLHQNDPSEWICRIRSKVMIIATDSALYWCLTRKIVPDLVVTLDPHPTRIVRWFGDPSLNRQAIQQDDYFARQEQEPSFNTDEFSHNRRVIELIDTFGLQLKFAIASCSSPRVAARIAQTGAAMYWWNPMYDDDDNFNGLTRQIYQMNRLPCVNAGGNVGTACWVFAHSVFHFKKIGLLGIDFGYPMDLPYEKTQYFNELKSLLGEERIQDGFLQMNNPQTGTRHYTDPAYAWYRDVFLEMAQICDCDTINLSGGGLLFGPNIRFSSWDDFICGLE